MRFHPSYTRMCVALTLSATLLTACATQRYGRMTPLSNAERSAMTCHDIALDTAKTQEFLNNISSERRNVSGAHVLGALGDFGIGNMMEGDAAEESGAKRLQDLQALSVSKHCK